MLLELRQVRKKYADAIVIPSFSLAVHEGDFVGVIGPNGAGKSTLFGLIAGSLRCDGGQVFLDGRDVTAQRADLRCRAGIGRTFQIPQPFPGMSAYENVLVCACYGAGLREHEAEREACAALRRCGLDAVADTPAGRLPLPLRRRLELARAIAGRPRLLLLDEVASGLADAEATEIASLVRQIHAQGATVLWIEHLVHVLVSVVRRLVVLTDGQTLSDGEPRSVIASQLVRETYLGEELELEAGMAHAGR